MFWSKSIIDRHVTFSIKAPFEPGYKVKMVLFIETINYRSNRNRGNVNPPLLSLLDKLSVIPPELRMELSRNRRNSSRRMRAHP